MDNSSREQFQSETGRGIDSLVRPSSLFYTVSGHHLNKGKYVHEILGCPSIIKPSFRDLPGCTRLSVGVPSQSYRPLDKLNKTMGKSTTSNQGKRHSRGESKFPPIKVNAKIRHIYSQLTSTEPPTPPQPQIATISTQTDFEIFSEQTEEQEKPGGSAKRDAFTCISPPPVSDAFRFVESTSPADKLPAIPPSYLSKLEDLEKITGHIVIQRFFTRADEAFGCWLEKQLGVNNKSVGVDTSDNIEILEDSAVNEGTSSTSTTLNAPTTPCKVDDGVKCECFLELFKASEENEVEESSKEEKETSLDPFEQDLLSQCIAYEILGDGSVRNAKKLVGRKGLVPQEKVCEESEENNSVQIEETESKKRLSQASIDREVTEELIKNMDQLISELPSGDYVQRNPEGDFESKKEFKAAVERVIKSKESAPGEPGDQQDVSSEAIEATLSDSLQNETETSGTKEDSVIEQPQGSLNEEIVSSAERPCIPDVIDVADLSASDRFSLESEMSQVALESQSKVVEYLGKIDPSAAAAMDEEGMEDFLRPSDEISQGECSGQTDERKELKRSLSIDSCIGTESSGETKHGLNDSGILLDSGRAVDFDGVSETTRSTVAEIAEAEESSRIENSTKLLEEETRNDLTSKSTEEPKDSSVEKPKSPSRTLSNRSVDESILSHSEEQSSTIQRGGSDGDTEDADQSDSDEELSSLSLRRARRASSSGISGMPIVTEETEDLVVVDDDDEEEEVDEQEPLDQFDAMIESHEREKRLLRPICRKRNVSTQTTKSVESSLISSATSRSTTATSSTNSSFDLEFVSKKYMTNVSPDGVSGGGEKRRAYLPSGASSLNILNMKFSVGRDFESEFSIRIPNKPSPTGSGCSIKGPHENIPSAANTPRSGTTTTTTRVDRGTQALALRPSESDLRSLWKDVKSKMETRVGTVDTQFPSVSRERDLLVTGNRMKLIAYDEVLAPPQEVQTVDNSHLHLHSPLPPPISSSTSIVTQEREERLKRSLKRLKKILDA